MHNYATRPRHTPTPHVTPHAASTQTHADAHADRTRIYCSLVFPRRSYSSLSSTAPTTIASAICHTATHHTPTNTTTTSQTTQNLLRKLLLFGSTTCVAVGVPTSAAAYEAWCGSDERVFTVACRLLCAVTQPYTGLHITFSRASGQCRREKLKGGEEMEEGGEGREDRNGREGRGLPDYSTCLQDILVCCFWWPLLRFR